jgi:hypothetical protein
MVVVTMGHCVGRVTVKVTCKIVFAMARRNRQ